MASAIKVTEAELLEALASARPGAGPDAAQTTKDMVKASGLSETRVKIALRAFHEQGRLQLHTVYREAFNGRMVPITAYTILPPKKAKK